MGSRASVVKTQYFTEPSQVCEGHAEAINCLAISVEGDLIASGSDDTTVRLWRLKDRYRDASLACEQILVGHDRYITVLQFYGDILWSGSADRTVRKWDIQNGKCLCVLEGHDDIITTISCVGNYVISASNDRSAICWRFDTGRLQSHLKGHTNKVSSVAYSSTGALPSAERQGEAVASSATFSSRVSSNGAGQNLMRRCERVFTGSADRTAKAWSLRSGRCYLTYRGHTGAITQIAVAIDGRTLYTASLDGTVRSWFTETGKTEHVFEGHKGGIIYLQLEDKMLFTGGSDKTARSWLTTTGAQVRIYRGQKRPVTKVQKVGSSVLLATSDGCLRCFDEKTGSLYYVYTNPNREGCSTFELTDNYLFTTMSPGNIVVWSRWDNDWTEGSNDSDLMDDDE